ncbi:glycosyltransferase family 4 protein [Dyadobacter sediminis]|uniref:Glycosyltransferase family 4 protein n=1 Tax=Dyadobacter sediminis TaxID=1493691 RepID=A0A5R9K748_9BACT|nr:glycosyltransferase family 4 protein [Dyadobacter sediminis]TLU89602.1 glycosyltransferase family 4 protein [Dyadobacter sediminis]GGC03930.1 glycosyltransferase WbuB [Dyadobacter sediminis]
MHILLIHQFFLEDSDGGGSRWNEMCRIWVREGHKVTVIAGTAHYMDSDPGGNGKEFITEKFNRNQVKVIRCRISGNYNSGFAGRLRGYFSFTFSGIWAGFFHAKNKYDVILVTSPPLFAGITAVVLSWLKRIPFVFEIRDLWPESAVDTGVLTNKFLIWLAFRFEKYLLRKATAINVLTPAFRDALIHSKKVNPEKIIYIPNAADFSIAAKVAGNFDRDAFRRAQGFENKFVLIYVGAHGVANHLEQIIETAEILKGTNAYFLLIGDGMQKKALLRHVQRRGLENVGFMNTVPRTEVFRYILASEMGMSVLKKADAFKTVYSNKTFDYFSFRKPILMAIDGISRELVEKANAGAFVEPENAKDFAEKIRMYMNNPEMLSEQGNNGYNYARMHFDRDVLALKYLRYLENTVCK